MSRELKPCPFCGVGLYECTYDGGKIRYAHEANGCTLSRKFVQGEAQEEAWNARALSAPALSIDAEAVEKQWCAHEDGHQVTSWKNGSEGDRLGWETLAANIPSRFKIVTRQLYALAPDTAARMEAEREGQQ